MTKEFLAEWLHDNYEQLAKANEWQTQVITRVKFEDLPAENKSTMLALADKMLNTFKIIAVQADVSHHFSKEDLWDAWWASAIKTISFSCIDKDYERICFEKFYANKLSSSNGG